jgi:hypothetical protein
MDGGTAVKTRMNLVDQFNSNNEIPVFLLSTKVGGLGLNLSKHFMCNEHINLSYSSWCKSSDYI